MACQMPLINTVFCWCVSIWGPVIYHNVFCHDIQTGCIFLCVFHSQSIYHSQNPNRNKFHEDDFNIQSIFFIFDICCIINIYIFNYYQYALNFTTSILLNIILCKYLKNKQPQIKHKNIELIKIYNVYLNVDNLFQFLRNFYT